MQGGGLESRMLLNLLQVVNGLRYTLSSVEPLAATGRSESSMVAPTHGLSDSRGMPVPVQGAAFAVTASASLPCL